MISHVSLRILSDLHLEHAPFSISWHGEDLLIIAGDISPCIRQCQQLVDAYLASAPETTWVLVVAGNHDYYGGSVSQGIAEWRGISHERLRYLENDSVVISGVRFWGATMWTNLRGMDPVLVRACVRELTDFEAITRFEPAEYVARHRASKQHLDYRGAAGCGQPPLA